jgi:hypothetical protein
MAKRKVNILTGITLDELSCVNAGANGAANALFSKSLGSGFVPIRYVEGETVIKYSVDQPRDDAGKFTSGGSAGASAGRRSLFGRIASHGAAAGAGAIAGAALAHPSNLRPVR